MTHVPPPTRAQEKLRELVATYKLAAVAKAACVGERELRRLLAGQLPSLRTAYELSEDGIAIEDWFPPKD